MRYSLWMYLLITNLVYWANSIIDITSNGALPHQDHLSAQIANQRAILKSVI